jgi:hypothetical protein
VPDEIFPGTPELSRQPESENEQPAAAEQAEAPGVAAPVAEPAAHAAVLAGTGPAGQRALGRAIAAAYGNQHFQQVARAVLAREDTVTEAGLVAQLDDELDDVFVDEAKCIALIEQMSASEKASITTASYRNKLADALDVAEMTLVVRALNPPLATKLEWLSAAAGGPSDLTLWHLLPLITAAPESERNALKTDEWRKFFVDVCDDLTMSMLVDILFTTLKDKVGWLAAEDVPWSMLRSRLQAETDPAQKVALYADDAIRDGFVSACDNDEMAEAVILIGGTMEQKQAWMDEEGTSTEEYLNALVRLQVFEPGAIAHTKAKDADAAISLHLGELVKDARGDGRQIAGMVAVVGDDDFNLAGVNHYGADVWATKSLAGFVDSDGRVWIHKDSGNAGTMIHEGLHKWSKDDVLDISQPLNEGVTEYFTRKVCTALTPPITGRTNYQANFTVTTSLVGLVGETTTAAAYFDGDTDGLEAAYVNQKSQDDWTAFIAATEANDWTTAATLV